MDAKVKQTYLKISRIKIELEAIEALATNPVKWACLENQRDKMWEIRDDILKYALMGIVFEQGMDVREGDL